MRLEQSSDESAINAEKQQVRKMVSKFIKAIYTRYQPTKKSHRSRRFLLSCRLSPQLFGIRKKGDYQANRPSRQQNSQLQILQMIIHQLVNYSILNKNYSNHLKNPFILFKITSIKIKKIILWSSLI